MKEKPQQGEVVSLTQTRADRFLHSLARKPFVAIIFDGQVARIYVKADVVLDNATLRMMRAAIDHLEEQETDAH